MTLQDLIFHAGFVHGDEDKTHLYAHSKRFENGYSLMVETGTWLGLEEDKYLVKGIINVSNNDMYILGPPYISNLPIYFQSQGAICDAEGVTIILSEMEALPKRGNDIALYNRYELFDAVHKFYVTKDKRRKGKFRAICVLDGDEFGYNIRTESCEWPIYDVDLNNRSRLQLVRYFNARLALRNIKKPPRRMSERERPLPASDNTGIWTDENEKYMF